MKHTLMAVCMSMLTHQLYIYRFEPHSTDHASSFFCFLERDEGPMPSSHRLQNRPANRKSIGIHSVTVYDVRIPYKAIKTLRKDCMRDLYSCFTKYSWTIDFNGLDISLITTIGVIARWRRACSSNYEKWALSFPYNPRQTTNSFSKESPQWSRTC